MGWDLCAVAQSALVIVAPRCVACKQNEEGWNSLTLQIARHFLLSLTASDMSSDKHPTNRKFLLLPLFSI